MFEKRRSHHSHTGTSTSSNVGSSSRPLSTKAIIIIGIVVGVIVAIVVVAIVIVFWKKQKKRNALNPPMQQGTQSYLPFVSGGQSYAPVANPAGPAEAPPMPYQNQSPYPLYPPPSGPPPKSEGANPPTYAEYGSSPYDPTSQPRPISGDAMDFYNSYELEKPSGASPLPAPPLKTSYS